MEIQATTVLTRKQWKDKNDKHKKRAKRRGLAHSATLTDYKQVLDSHQGRCSYCGVQAILTIDHIIPMSRGGGHIRSNIAFACFNCNQKKDSMMVDEFLSMINFRSMRNAFG